MEIYVGVNNPVVNRTVAEAGWPVGGTQGSGGGLTEIQIAQNAVDKAKKDLRHPIHTCGL